MAEKLAVTDVDGLFIGLFISKRDGKPLVGFSMGTVEEADQARFDEVRRAGCRPLAFLHKKIDVGGLLR